MNDSECPLNAKCNSGICDFPETVIPISPRKFIIPNVSNYNLQNGNRFLTQISNSDTYFDIPTKFISKLNDGSFVINISNTGLNINDPNITFKISKKKGIYEKIINSSEFSKYNQNSLLIPQSVFLIN